MTDLSATPTQQLARIQYVEDHVFLMPETLQPHISWLCTIARQGMEDKVTAEAQLRDTLRRLADAWSQVRERDAKLFAMR